MRKDDVGFLAEPGDASSFAAQLRDYDSLLPSEPKALQERIEQAAHEYSFAATVRDYSRALEIALTHVRARGNCN